MLKEMVDQSIQRYADPQMRLNHIREQLQRIILAALHEARAFNSMAFVGGTCLRVVHGLRRYSEDLDFSLADGDRYDFPAFLQKTKTKLNAMGIEHTLKLNTKKTVHAAQIGFPAVRRMVGENPMADAKLTIRLEVDTNPPCGWKTEHHIQRSDFGLAALVSYDLPSLFAGKLHALCCRKYAKGRDWYDLAWYLTRQPPTAPNLDLLTNAVAQTEGGEAWNGAGWRACLQSRVRQFEMADLKADVSPFIERKEDLDVLSVESLSSLIGVS